MMKKLGSMILVTMLLVALVGCGGGAKKPEANKATDKFIMKVGYGTAPGHPIAIGSEKFKELVEKRSNGRIEVRLFPSAQLGSERQMLEGLQSGTLEATPTSTGPMGLFEPGFFVFDLPYIFKDAKAADSVLDGSVGTELAGRLEKIGMVSLAWWENGMREITNSRGPIVNPTDVKGLKLRTMENEVHMKFFKNLGATPTPMGFGEVYMALKQKTVDAQENPLAIIANNKFYEVQKYMTISDHVYSPAIFLVSKKWYDKLPADLQKIVKDTAFELRVMQRNEGREQEKKYIELCKKGGMEITVLTPEQKALWQAEALKIYPDFEAKIGKDLLEKVKKEGWK